MNGGASSWREERKHSFQREFRARGPSGKSCYRLRSNSQFSCNSVSTCASHDDVQSQEFVKSIETVLF